MTIPASTWCWFQHPPLYRYERIMSGYNDSWNALTSEGRVGILRVLWRQRKPLDA